MRYLGLMTGITERLYMTHPAFSPILAGEPFVVTFDKFFSVPIGTQLHLRRMTESAIARDVPIFGRHQFPLIAMVEAVTLRTSPHVRPLYLVWFMRPLIMTIRAGNLALKVRRMIEIDQFGILPFLQIAMASLAG